jgi:hypothetical protein
MSDTTTHASDEAQEAEAGAEESTTVDPRISKANQEAARYRKEARAAQAELDKVRQAGLSEQEKAVAAAKAEGTVEAARAAAPRLVKAELRAAAAEAGLSKEALAGFMEYADLSRFVGEDGEVDDKQVTAAIKKLGGDKRTDFDGGARTSAAKPTDMNSLIRRQVGMG